MWDVMWHVMFGDDTVVRACGGWVVMAHCRVVKRMALLCLITLSTLTGVTVTATVTATVAGSTRWSSRRRPASP